MKESDVLVYCAIYCGWVICFLPDTLVHLNAYVLYKLFMLFLRFVFYKADDRPRELVYLFSSVKDYKNFCEVPRL